jgi:hypothetical protein
VATLVLALSKALALTLGIVLIVVLALAWRLVGCPSPKLRKTMILSRVTMLPASLHAIHFKHILNFGEGHLTEPLVLESS